MLFMVIEHFTPDQLSAVGARFERSGRMLPDRVTYVHSWMESSGSRCFQLMEAPHLDALNLWTARWSDLVHFEIVPVQTSADFWSARQAKSS